MVLVRLLAWLVRKCGRSVLIVVLLVSVVFELLIVAIIFLVVFLVIVVLMLLELLTLSQPLSLILETRALTWLPAVEVDVVHFEFKFG